MAGTLLAFNESNRPIGESHHRSKLTQAMVDQMFALHEQGLSYRAIADKFDDVPGGVGKETVRDVLTFRTWCHVATRLKRVENFVPRNERNP